MTQRSIYVEERIATGHKDQSVRINAIYSYGLDDKEFVLPFELDEPKDFLDLMMELRDPPASSFTIKDTPAFTSLMHPVNDVLDLLDKLPSSMKLSA